MSSHTTTGTLSGIAGAELLKLVKRPATWVLLSLWPVMQLLFSFVIPYISYLKGNSFEGRPPEASLASTLPDKLVENATGGLPLFGGALLLTLGALMAGSEYGWGTLKTVVTQNPKRLSILSGQLLALLVILAGTVLGTFVLNVAASWLIATIESAPIDWPAFPDLAAGFGGGLLIALMWGTLGILLGTLLRGLALAIGLGLVWVLAFENLIVNVAAPLLAFFDTAQKALPGVNAGSLVAALAGPNAAMDTPGVAAIVPGGQAAWVLGGYLVVFVLITALLLKRRDIT